MLYKFVTTCRLCLSDSLETVIPMQPMPVGDRYLAAPEEKTNKDLIPLGINICRDCGNVQTDTIIDRTVTYNHYLSRPAAVNSQLSQAYSEYAHKILDYVGEDSCNYILEVGSNDGAFLKYFVDKNLNVQGVDAAENLCKIANSRGIGSIHAFFSENLAVDICNKKGKASAVVANFVMANVEDMHDFIKGVRNVLADEGIFSFETNDCVSVVKNQLIETLNHEHLSYFAINPISKFLNNYGFQIFDAEIVPSKGGSLRCFVKFKASDRPIKPAVKDLADQETAENPYSAEFYAPYIKDIVENKSTSQKTLETIVNSGGTVFGYGTSIGGSVLIYQLGIQNYLSKLVDDDPFRQGLFSPGLNLPVVSPDTLISEHPKAVVILAPQYTDKIVAHNQEYIATGGQFIQIWPTVKYI